MDNILTPGPHRAVILGASDPEMAFIRRLAETMVGTVVLQATANGRPVHPGTAYQADGLDRDCPETALEIVAVECGGPIFDRLAQVECRRIIRVDHHRPGDPGYGVEPDRFLPASSAGQFYQLHREWSGIGQPQYVVRDGRWRLIGTVLRRPCDCCDILPEHQWEELVIEDVPDELVLVSAADHCLPAAYQGQCPGVDPDRLMTWRAESRAAYQRRPVEAVLADIEAARKLLRERFDAQLGYADFRGVGVIAELPEAAAREGIPFVTEIVDPDGRHKVVLQSAPAYLVREFLAGRLVPGLTGMYGDPARGFAGGYK